jgi:hypothetical protein
MSAEAKTLASMKLKIPSDVLDVTNFLLSMKSELSDVMWQEAKDAILSLREEVQMWKAGGCEPDWDAYRSIINRLCADDGMPNLFGE